jgi:diaminohydroxyphosphoribosylaminopyrimidine deaminase / 5-amino-6-(5-phosphoribosylamino)uracil reductase
VELDHHMMGIALMMAQRGLGTTAPNPSVGAVICEPTTGEVIARGTTARGGRPHAETIAIASAGSRTKGATLYVTLEPCSHHGSTPPCADAIIAAGIERVVCAIEDPDPRVAGRGLNRLRAHGIAVTRGVRAAEAAYLTRGHIVRVTERRPFVQLKLALDGNGVVPRGRDGAPVFVTSPLSRAMGHMMRAQTGAILVGHGTVVSDNPDLTCRLPGLAARSPQRIVLARHGLQLGGTKLAVSAGRVSLTVFTGPDVPDAIAREMQTQGASVRPTMVVGGQLWLPAILEALAASGVTRLLVEGGPTVWRAFAQSGLVDEVVLFVAGPGASDPHALAARHLGSLPLTLKDRREIGKDTMWTLAADQKTGSHDGWVRRSLAP